MSAYSYFKERFEDLYLDSLANLIIAYNVLCKELDETKDEEKQYLLEGKTTNLREDILRLKKIADNLKIPLTDLNNRVEQFTKEEQNVLSRN